MTLPSLLNMTVCNGVELLASLFYCQDAEDGKEIDGERHSRMMEGRERRNRNRSRSRSPVKF